MMSTQWQASPHLCLIVQLRGCALLLCAALGHVCHVRTPLRHSKLFRGLAVKQQGAVLKRTRPNILTHLEGLVQLVRGRK